MSQDRETLAAKVLRFENAAVAYGRRQALLEEYGGRSGDPMESVSEELVAARAALLATPAPGQADRWRPTHRHVKRGSEYEIVGHAELQIATNDVVEGSSLTIYRNRDGKLWAREQGEFEDGRFVEIPAPPAQDSTT